MDELGRQKSKEALGFISNLTHVEGTQFAGKPFHLFLWQTRIIHKLFGTLKENGYRQYRTCYVEVPKKNGKSELGAAIALKLLCADGEIGAEIYSVASDKEQAGIVFRKAAQMVRNSEELTERLRIIDSQKRIVDYKTNSYYRVLSSDVETKHGFNPHGVIFDELHAQPNRKLWDVLTVGTDAARKQQMIFVMTTSGFDRNSICWEVHSQALRIKKGISKDPTFLPIIFNVDEEEDWKDERNWVKANPSLGKIFDIENLRQGFKEATEIPAKENEFRRLRLDQWTSSSTRWIRIEDWDACATPVDLDSFSNRNCYGGMDLSSTLDISAFSLLFEPLNGDGIFDLITYFWMPSENVEKKSRMDRVDYDLWHRQGLIETTEGNVIDSEYIRTKINELGKIYNIQEIGYDPWNATSLAVGLGNDGFKMIPVRQGFASLSAPTKELMTLVMQKKIHHGGNPILRYMSDSMVLTQDAAGNVKPDKAKSNARIDGIVSTIIALDRASRNGPGTSIYDTRGILVVG